MLSSLLNAEESRLFVFSIINASQKGSLPEKSDGLQKLFQFATSAYNSTVTKQFPASCINDPFNSKENI